MPSPSDNVRLNLARFIKHQLQFNLSKGWNNTSPEMLTTSHENGTQPQILQMDLSSPNTQILTGKANWELTTETHLFKGRLLTESLEI